MLSSTLPDLIAAGPRRRKPPPAPEVDAHRRRIGEEEALAITRALEDTKKREVIILSDTSTRLKRLAEGGQHYLIPVNSPHK